MNLIQSSSIWVTGHHMPVSDRGLGRVILFLVFLQGTAVNRTFMARQLWPGEPEEVTANRLRVSLNRIRSMLGSALVTDRSRVSLTGISVVIDLKEKGARLEEALDEVDSDRQFELLKSLSATIRWIKWRELLDLDSSGLLRDWDVLCRKSIRQLMEIAVKNRDWDSVEFVRELMRDRNDLDLQVCEQYLDAHDFRGTLDEGSRKIRETARECGLDETSEIRESLKKYA